MLHSWLKPSVNLRLSIGSVATSCMCILLIHCLCDRSDVINCMPTCFSSTACLSFGIVLVCCVCAAKSWFCFGQNWYISFAGCSSPKRLRVHHVSFWDKLSFSLHCCWKWLPWNLWSVNFMVLWATGKAYVAWIRLKVVFFKRFELHYLQTNQC